MNIIRADPPYRLRSYITTPHPDRSGDTLNPLGLLNRDEYLANPVVLWAHQLKQPPIGHCLSLDVAAKGIVAETQFNADDPIARDIYRLYARGILRAWSIGFIPKRVTPSKFGSRVEEWELLEYSAVPIPDNPHALTLAVERGEVREKSVRDWLADVMKPLLASA